MSIFFTQKIKKSLRLNLIPIIIFLWACHIPLLAEERQSHHNFVVFTPPKAGTHLLCNVLGLMLGEAPMITDELETDNIVGQADRLHARKHFLVTHSLDSKMLKTLVKHGYKILFILRDPRDQLISMCFTMRQGYWNDPEVAKIASFEEQITELISGEKYGWRCFEEYIANRLALVKALPKDKVHITSFEKLVGPLGHGNRTIQIFEIQDIADFLDIQLSEAKEEEIATHSFGNTWSFRSGQIGSWKQHFTPFQKEMYRSLYSQMLIDLGYEKNNMW